MSGVARSLSSLHGAAALGLGAFAALSIQLAPLGLRPTDAPSPNLFFCVLAYFALRRPQTLGPATLFALSRFEMQDGDMLYASDALITEIRKVFGIFTDVTGQVSGVTRIGG